MTKTKKPIGFASWSEKMENNSEKSEEIVNIDLEKAYENKEKDYHRMVDDLIDEVSDGYRTYLREKRRRILAEMRNIEAEKEIEELKKEIENLKNEKKEAEK